MNSFIRVIFTYDDLNYFVYILFFRPALIILNNKLIYWEVYEWIRHLNSKFSFKNDSIIFQ